MIDNHYNILAAPVQGHTDAAYRHFHHVIYGGDLEYFTPFIRLEKGEIRKRDVADLTSVLNEGLRLTPQIIFKNRQELETLVQLIKELGFNRIDLNMGCPFPLQTARGRGAATLGKQELAVEVADVISHNQDVEFSVKMRLGMADDNDWRPTLSELNKVKLRFITVHPRVAKQQYGGELHLDKFAEILSESSNPVVFNGDIVTPQDVTERLEMFPEVKGVMCGRGLLGRPSLAAEVSSAKEWSEEQRLSTMLRFSRSLFDHYGKTLEGGEHQVLDKIKPFWEYAEKEIGRKAWKQIKKSSNLAKYHTALALDF